MFAANKYAELNKYCQTAAQMLLQAFDWKLYQGGSISESYGDPSAQDFEWEVSPIQLKNEDLAFEVFAVVAEVIEWDHTLDAYLAGCYDYLEQDPYYRVALNPHAGLPDVLADQRISGILEMLASADDPHTDTPITEEELAKELEELAGILGRVEGERGSSQDAGRAECWPLRIMGLTMNKNLEAVVQMLLQAFDWKLFTAPLDEECEESTGWELCPVQLKPEDLKKEVLETTYNISEWAWDPSIEVPDYLPQAGRQYMVYPCMGDKPDFSDRVNTVLERVSEEMFPLTLEEGDLDYDAGAISESLYEIKKVLKEIGLKTDWVNNIDGEKDNER